MQQEEVLVIPKTWRSELSRFCLFLALSAGCVVLSKMFPVTIIEGKLFALNETAIFLRLPLLWLLPMGALASAIFRIYNVRYSIDNRGIEARVGVLSLHQSITRIRFEDIRSIETEQTLIERLLNVGIVEMGTAATGGLEMVFHGVDSPRHIQEMIQHERDLRVKKAALEHEKHAHDINKITGAE